jgi:uncharacterized protein (DUF433 family)
MHYYTAIADRERRAVVLKTRLLSLRETMVLAGVAEREKEVRNDITHGVLRAANVIRIDNCHLCFHWPYVLTFAAVYGNKFLDNSQLRRVALEKVFVVATGCSEAREMAWVTAVSNATMPSGSDWYRLISKCEFSKTAVDIDNYIAIKLGKACEDVKPRVHLYAEGLDQVEERDAILGGEAVFRDSRVSVSHIGEMAERGVSTTEIVEDYKLTEGDVEFAKLYFRARPPVGRPRGGARKHVETELK